jgi:RAB protein geranylgeranyltransferase component A
MSDTKEAPEASVLDADEQEEPKPEEAPRDKEGLLLEYDVIVCGTGLVQSILASALARAGKTVLHCDGSDHYGELDAVWNLEFINNTLLRTNDDDDDESAAHDYSSPSSESSLAISLSPRGAHHSFRVHSSNQVTSFDIQEGDQVQTPYGVGVVTALPDQTSTSTLAVSLNQWTLANEKSPVAYFGIDKEILGRSESLTSYLATTHNIQSFRSLQARKLLESRSLALDASPTFVFAAGRAVQGMLASGVAEYLEFKTLEGLFWLDDTKMVSRVPCSKGDVFSTKLLKPMDKRRLMKFLQLSMDYATSLSIQEEIQPQQSTQQEKVTADDTKANEPLPDSVEEVKNQNERHLNQGRSLARPQNKAVATGDLQVLQECITQGMDFDTYLSDQKLSPLLRSLVRYALTMETTDGSTSLLESMTKLRHHLQSLGRYGTTAFLVPQYGSGELSQAFCRSAAVFGATYLLRRAPLQVLLSKENNKVEGVLLGGDQSDDEHALEGSQNNKTVRCSQVVVSTQSLMRPSNQRILRRISILRGKLMQSDNGEQRHVIVIPPNSLGNPYAIHGVAVDESVQVAPSGCTVLHLTTTVDVVADNKEVDDSILRTACQILFAAEQTGEVDEIYHLSFSHDVSEMDSSSSESSPEGMFVCGHSGQGLAADVAFEQAQQLFSKMLPGMEFLGLSEEIDTVVKERAAERFEEDDEKLMLDSAVGMIESPSPPQLASEGETKEDQEVNKE